MKIEKARVPEPVQRSLSGTAQRSDMPGLVLGLGQVSYATRVLPPGAAADASAMFLKPEQTFSIFEADDMVVGGLKLVTKVVAKQFSSQYAGATVDALWICFDALKLAHDWNKPNADRIASCFTLAGTVVDAVQVPGSFYSSLKIPESVTQTVDIFIKSGEVIHKATMPLTAFPGLTPQRFATVPKLGYANVAAAFDPNHPGLQAVPTGMTAK